MLYGARQFITVFTTAHHFSISPPTQSSPRPPTSFLLAPGEDYPPTYAYAFHSVFSTRVPPYAVLLSPKRASAALPRSDVTSYLLHHTSFSAPTLEHPQAMFLSKATDQVSHPYESSQNCNYVQYISVFTFSHSTQADRSCRTAGWQPFRALNLSQCT
jgi:hypothetical protein